MEKLGRPAVTPCLETVLARVVDSDQLSQAHRWIQAKCSLIRALEREGQRSGEVYEKIGPDHWLALDPGDRFDGEETTPSHAILRIYKAGIRVLFTPGGA